MRRPADTFGLWARSAPPPTAAPPAGPPPDAALPPWEAAAEPSAPAGPPSAFSPAPPPAAAAPGATGQPPAPAPPERPSRRPGRRPPGPAGRRALPPSLQAVLAFAVYLLMFSMVFARPLLGHLSQPEVKQYWTDPNFYTWALRWWPYALTHGLNPLYSAQIGAPGGYNLAWATTTPSVSLLMWPVTAALGPVTSFNVMLLLVPPASGLTAFIAARRLTSRFWPSLVAGVVYGFSPFELTHSLQGQPNLTMTALPPLLVYLVLLWWDGTLGRVGLVTWSALVMALEFYTFSEAFADMTMVGAVALLAGFAVAGRGLRAKVARLAGLLAIGYAGAILLAAPYLDYALRHYPATLTRQLPIFSLSLIRLILPSSDRLYGLTSLVGYSASLGRYSIENYVGIPLLAVLVALAVFAWRSRLSRLLLIVFLLVVALACGPGVVVGKHQVAGLPWGWVWSLPFLRSGEPSRLMVFGYLVLTLALALWLAGQRAAPRALAPAAARWLLGLLAVAVLLADLPTFAQVVNPHQAGYRPPPTMHATNQLPVFITEGLYQRYLTPGETVVVVTHRGNAGMLFQAEADFYFKIAGGFINTSLTRQDAMPLPVSLLTHPTKARERGFTAYLRRAHVGAVLVDRAWSEPWMKIFDRLGMPGTTAGGVTVYPVSAWLGSADQRKLAP